MLLPIPLLALAVHVAAASSFRDLGIPPSSSTVNVKVLNGIDADVLPASAFLFPVVPGRENADIDVYAFLIEHKSGRVMFDLAIRKDFENLAPFWTSQLKLGLLFNVSRDIPTQLQDGGVALDTVQSVIWSHSHADHVGDMSLWPNTTELVIGEATDTRTFPTFPNASLVESDFAGKTVRKISFEDSPLKIGPFSAVDFFGDGSAYLLDVPGHCPGHMALLARVTPSSFIFLAGDTFHQAGQVRPSPHLHTTFPVPSAILSESRKTIARPFFWAPDDDTDLSNRTTPMLTVANGPTASYFDPVTSRTSQFDVGLFDSNPDVLVLTAHDPTMHNLLDFFPKTLNSWQAKGWKQQGVWQFANSTSRGYRLS